MYIKKLEYLQQLFNQKYLRSGLTVKSIKSLSIGTPCLIDINKGDNFLRETQSKRAKERRPETPPELIDQPELIDPPELIDLYLKRENISANILFLFNTYNEAPDFIISNNKTSKIYYTDDKPLIYDSYSSTLLKSSERNAIVNNIFEQLKDQLTNNRFVNYVFEDIKSSNVNNVIFDVKKIAKMLSKNYQSNTSFYQYVYSGSRVLIDTLSISFYKMRDVIPVFNYKKSDGICMEIMLTNSELKGKLFEKRGYSMVYRFLFARHNENIFFIDGEPIMRPNDIPVTNGVDLICDLLRASTPKDMTKSSSDQSTKQESKEKQKKVAEIIEV